MNPHRPAYAPCAFALAALIAVIFTLAHAVSYALSALALTAAVL